jgi:hypothetical protein
MYLHNGLTTRRHLKRFNKLKAYTLIIIIIIIIIKALYV